MRNDPDDDPTTFHVRRAAAGDQEGLSWVIERFSPILSAQARYRLGPELSRRIDPQDVVQEAWMIAASRLDDLVPRDGRLTPVLLRFLSTILINRANDHLRRFFRGQPGMATLDEIDEPMAREVSQTFRQVARAEVLEELEGALRGLSDDEAEVVRLRGFEGWSNAETACLLGLDANTVAQRWLRALGHLRKSVSSGIFDELD